MKRLCGPDLDREPPVGNLGQKSSHLARMLGWGSKLGHIPAARSGASHNTPLGLHFPLCEMGLVNTAANWMMNVLFAETCSKLAPFKHRVVSESVLMDCDLHHLKAQ